MHAHFYWASSPVEGSYNFFQLLQRAFGCSAWLLVVWHVVGKVMFDGPRMTGHDVF
jgi:hypothetical protein